jgi:hypothetical protein
MRLRTLTLLEPYASLVLSLVDLLTTKRRSFLPRLRRAKNSVRVMQRLAAYLPHDSQRLRDITQAYSVPMEHQTILRWTWDLKSEVQRKIVCEVPPELGLPVDCVLVVIRHLHGLPEAALHWLVTYGISIRMTSVWSRLRSTRASFTPKVNVNHLRGWPGTCTILPDGLVALQVDDSFVSGSPVFLREELEKIAQFQCKIATDIISPYCRFSSA